jgi:hypothetical protein
MANAISYGFTDLQHVFSEKLSAVNVETISTAISLTVAEHNRQADAMLAELSERTTAYTTRFKQRDAGTLQPLDEQGNPLPRKPAGHYDVAYPIFGGGTAWGDNRVSRAMASVADVNRNMLEMLGDDASWMKRHVLAALLDNTTFTFDDPEHGEITVQPLALATDGVTYPRNNGSSSTATHHVAQAAGVANATNPFPVIKAALEDHPVNGGGPIVSYIPTNIVDDVEGLSSFIAVSDPNIRLGANSNELAGSISRGFGDEVLGYADGVWIVKWSALPNNYILSVARGASEPVLKMREYDAAELQGLFTENHSPDGNLREYRFLRYAGFGAHNRVGAFVTQVAKGDTTYVVPAGFARPIGV